MKKLLLVLLCISILAASMVGCNGSSQTTSSGSTASLSKTDSKSDTSDIHIALMAPLTGDNAQYGLAFQTGIQVKINEVNNAGGINGKQKIVLDTFDDKSTAKESANIAQLITSGDKYLAAIGSYSSTCSLAAGPVFTEAKMPLLTPCAGHVDLARKNEYVFQRGVTITVEAPMMARYAVEKLGGRHIAFVSLNNDAGIYFRDNALKQMETLKSKYNCEVVASEVFNEGQVRDFTPMLIKIKETNPDIVVMNLGYTECAAILLQAKQLGMTNKWYTNGSMYNEDFIKLAGDTAEGLYVNCVFFAYNPDPNIQEFVKQCKEIDGKVPNYYQRNAYECMAMVVYALEQGAKTGQEVYDKLLGIKEWKGKTGTCEWNDRQVSEEYSILQYLNGDWKMTDSATLGGN